MRIEIAGAQITDAVADVLDTLQNEPEVSKMYVRVLDELTRSVIMDITAIDEKSDNETLNRLRALQMIRRDLLTLSSPPDVDKSENDIATFSA